MFSSVITEMEEPQIHKGTSEKDCLSLRRLTESCGSLNGLNHLLAKGMHALGLESGACIYIFLRATRNAYIGFNFNIEQLFLVLFSINVCVTKDGKAIAKQYGR